MDTLTLVLAAMGVMASVVTFLFRKYDDMQTKHYNDMRAEGEQARQKIQTDRDWIWDKFWQGQDQADKRLDAMQQGIAALQTALTAVQTSQETVLALLRREQDHR